MWWWGNMKQAAAGGPTLVIHDEFTGTQNTNLSSHTIGPTNTVSASWNTGTLQLDGSGSLQITQAWSGNALSFAPSEDAPHFVAARIPASGLITIHDSGAGSVYAGRGEDTYCRIWNRENTLVSTATVTDVWVGIGTDGNLPTPFVYFYTSTDGTSWTLRWSGTMSEGGYTAMGLAISSWYSVVDLDDYKVWTNWSAW